MLISFSKTVFESFSFVFVRTSINAYISGLYHTNFNNYIYNSNARDSEIQL